MTRERTPLGQFTGVARISGLEIALWVACGSIFALVVVFAALYLVH